MSSISSVTSATNLYQPSNDFAKRFQDFKALGTALQSGDLSSAQSALANFQQTVSGNASTSTTAASQPFGKNSQANSDFQTLTSALQSGDMTGAQQAFTSLQSDLKAAHKGHHHHHDQDGGSTSAPSASSSASGTSSLTSAFGSIAALTSSSALANQTTDSDGDHDGSGLNVTA